MQNAGRSEDAANIERMLADYFGPRWPGSVEQMNGDLRYEAAVFLDQYRRNILPHR